MEAFLGLAKDIITIAIIIACGISILLIIFQADKGGGLGGLFGGAGGSSSQSVLGSRKADFIQRITTIFLGIFIFGSLLIGFLTKQEHNLSKPVEEDTSEIRGIEGDIDYSNLVTNEDAKTNQKDQESEALPEEKKDDAKEEATDKKETDTTEGDIKDTNDAGKTDDNTAAVENDNKTETADPNNNTDTDDKTVEKENKNEDNN